MTQNRGYREEKRENRMAPRENKTENQKSQLAANSTVQNPQQSV
ncbi:hypothetical protein [Mobiluncus mulieris]|nr:hypothetical protein [Mobiluncus mulieris]